LINFAEGVSLTTIDTIHLHLLRSWRNDFSTWRFCRQNDLISEQAQEGWFKRQDQDPTIKMYLILDGSHKPVGVAGLTTIDMTNRRAEFSLYIASEYRRQGLARKALKTLVSHGMSNLGLHSIWGESFEGNPAIKMFKEIGFQFDGSRRHAYFREGQFINAELFSILSFEWYSRREFNKRQVA
jgi:RimJ/RimL family protein N-acetyltransferase